LNTRFRRETGLSPKTVGRIARLYRAVELMAGSPSTLWSEVAATCGYADQAHLNLDFRALTGVTPTQLITLDDSQGQLYLGSRVTTKVLAATRTPKPTHSS
jgi:AraC-like DNA-binding protein